VTRRNMTTQRTTQMATTRHQDVRPNPSLASTSTRRWRPLRLTAFAVIALAVIALAVGGLAIGLVVSRLQGPGETDVTAIQVQASMGGFDPSAITVKAGQPVKIELSSMDNSMHSDGGGWHQLAIDALGIDWKVGPLSTKVFTFTAPGVAGTYAWYCDVCCGGKANPTMQGQLTVTA
jgi:cytochrome c oxidase subunit 2